MMKSSQNALFAASITAARGVVGKPYAIFSAMVPGKITLSCVTIPICVRTLRSVASRTSTPSISTFPDCGS